MQFQTKTVTTCLKKRTTFIFLNNSVKHWPILTILGKQHRKKLDINDCSFGHLTLIPLLHYSVKFRSRCLAVYSNQLFILSSGCDGSEMIRFTLTEYWQAQATVRSIIFQKVKCVTSHHLHYSTSASRTNAI